MSGIPKNSLCPYPVIVLAAGGDVDAINAVLRHYEGYITLPSRRNLRKAMVEIRASMSI